MKRVDIRLAVRMGGMLLCCVLASSAQAGAWMNQNHSASSLGVSNAVVASADDVAAAAYNPAGLAWQDGIQLMFGMDYRWRKSSVIQGGVKTGNNGFDNNLGHVYASWKPRDKPWGISLAYNTPFEVDNDWKSAFSTTSGTTSMRSERLSLDGLYAINSSLAFSVGADWYYTSAHLTQGVNSFQGKDQASSGVHAGMKWKFTPLWMFGASIRQGTQASLSGSANTSLSIKMPDELALAVAHDIDDALRVELDVDWVRWSQMKDLNVMTGNAITQANSLNLKDTISVKTGLTWFWREHTQIRFGYAYEDAANQTSGFHPMIADQVGHRLSLGAGGDMMGVHFDAAYAYTYHAKQAVNGDFTGTYGDVRHAFMLSITKSF